MEQSNKNMPGNDAGNNRHQGNSGYQPDQRQTDKKGDNGTNLRKEGERDTKNELTSADIPDSTNTSTGKMGSGQRQDTN